MQEKPGLQYAYADIQPQSLLHVDWEAAPSRFKLYRGCERVTLAHENGRQVPDRVERIVTRDQIGQMLSDIYGLTRLIHVAEENHHWFLSSSLQSLVGESHQSMLRTTLLRPVPSGGALFPCELYLLVSQGQSLPPGIYHYDAAHHTLDVLRDGDYSRLLCTYITHSEDSPPPYTLLLSCFFWKDGFKYGEFSYRLQGLDIGAVIAQSNVVMEHYSLETTVHYQFVDKDINNLLGLDPLHESVYALITVESGLKTASCDTHLSIVDPPEDQPQAQPASPVRQSESIARWPLPEAVHRSSLIETKEAFLAPRSLPPIKALEGVGSRSLPLTDTSPDLLSGLYKRHSTPGQFIPEPLTEQQLAHLLRASMHGCANDIDAQAASLQHTLLYCVINHVQNVSPGVYCYHLTTHTLELMREGDFQEELQATLKVPTRNMFHVSLCLFPVANYQDGFEVYGDRWYRMQNMEAGIITERLYLTSAALGLGCRANLGYREQKVLELLRLPDRWRSLIQVMVSPERHAYQYYEQSLLL